MDYKQQPVFRTYKEAHEKLKIPGSYQRGTIGTAETGVQSLKITEHPDSYDKILENGRRILYVGRGNKDTPAHPFRSQDSEKQQLFRTSIQTQNPFPVLHKSHANHVELLGYYRVHSLKQSTKKGIRFYYAELIRV